MAFAWQLGRPSISPPHTPFQCYSSIPALLISKEDKEEREAEAQSPPHPNPSLLLGGLDHTEQHWTVLRDLDNTVALQGTTANPALGWI